MEQGEFMYKLCMCTDFVYTLEISMKMFSTIFKNKINRGKHTRGK